MIENIVFFIILIIGMFVIKSKQKYHDKKLSIILTICLYLSGIGFLAWAMAAEITSYFLEPLVAYRLDQSSWTYHLQLVLTPEISIPSFVIALYMNYQFCSIIANFLAKRNHRLNENISPTSQVKNLYPGVVILCIEDDKTLCQEQQEEVVNISLPYFSIEDIYSKDTMKEKIARAINLNPKEIEIVGNMDIEHPVYNNHVFIVKIKNYNEIKKEKGIEYKFYKIEEFKKTKPNDINTILLEPEFLNKINSANLKCRINLNNQNEVVNKVIYH